MEDQARYLDQRTEEEKRVDWYREELARLTAANAELTRERERLKVEAEQSAVIIQRTEADYRIARRGQAEAESRGYLKAIEDAARVVEREAAPMLRGTGSGPYAGRRLEEAAAKIRALSPKGNTLSQGSEVERLNRPESADSCAASSYSCQALVAAETELERMTRLYHTNTRCQCSDDEACQHVQRAEVAEAEVERLTAENTMLKGMLKAKQDDCQNQRYNKNIEWKRAERLEIRVNRLSSALTEVSGCHSNHGTPKLCEGCLIAIGNALVESV